MEKADRDFQIKNMPHTFFVVNSGFEFLDWFCILSLGFEPLEKMGVKFDAKNFQFGLGVQTKHEQIMETRQFVFPKKTLVRITTYLDFVYEQ